MTLSNVPFTATLQVALEVLTKLDTPRSLAIFMLAREYLLDSYLPLDFSEQVESLGFRVNWYDQFTIKRFRDDYQATHLLSKLPPPEESDALRAAALLKLAETEVDSHKVNQNWSPASDFPQAFSQLECLGVPIENIRGILREILGRCPSLNTLNKNLVWTGGASVTFGRTLASAETKAELGRHVTPGLAKALADIDRLSPLLPSQPWFLIPGNLVSTVPKNITTDRTMAMGADINTVFQRALGSSIASRLLPWGISLHDQGMNQRYCARAHIDASATIDLKNASNRVLLFPVMQAFPADWAEMFLTLREPYGTIDRRVDVLTNGPSKSEWFEYAMLSSMGNGFTFEVETILFFAICLACGAEIHEVCVYGDDIIVPQRIVDLLVKVLDVFGLEVNTLKSFTTGTFFESCGAYYFHGVDVTPFKIKDLLDGPKDCLILANKIRLYANLCCNHNGCDKRMLSAWQMCVSRLPTNVRTNCRGPVGSGLLLYVNRNEILPNHAKYSRRRGCLEIAQLSPRIEEWEADFASLLPLRLQQLDFSTTGQDVFSLPYEFISLDRQLNSRNRGNVIKTTVKGWKQSPLFIYGDSWYDLGHWR